MFPPQRRGGVVECSPASGGGIPITPRNGAERTACEPRRHVSPSSDHVKVSPSGRSGSTSASQNQPALGTWNETEPPESAVSIGSYSGENQPLTRAAPRS